MVFGIDDALMIAAATATVASAAAKAAGQKGGVSEAKEDKMAQQMLAEKQMELATAGQEDIRGNKTVYVPGRGWITFASPNTAAIISASDDLMKRELVRQLTSGESERGRAITRRARESSAADPLLANFAGGYGLPTREGVRGRRTVTAATRVGENADLLRNAATSAALRSGGSTVPLGANLSNLNRSATTGLRSALAGADEEGDTMFQSQLRQAQSNMLDPYNMLANRASGVPQFTPENLSAGITSNAANAASVAAMTGTRGASEALARGSAGVREARRDVEPVNWDMLLSGIGMNIEDWLGGGGGGKSSTKPTITRTKSTQSYF